MREHCAHHEAKSRTLATVAVGALTWMSITACSSDIKLSGGNSDTPLSDQASTGDDTESSTFVPNGPSHDMSDNDGDSSTTSAVGTQAATTTAPRPVQLEVAADDNDGTNTPTKIDVEDLVDPVTAEQKAQCALALTGKADAAGIVPINGSVTQVTADSIVAVSTSGNGRLVMTAPVTLRGFCLFQRGGSEVRFSTAFRFQKLGVFSVGQPEATFLLADGASLETFHATAGGSALIGIYSPQNLDCSTLLQNAVVNGQPMLDCGTTPPGFN